MFLCNSYTKRVEQSYWKNEWKVNEKDVWQSNQHNCENGSAMTLKKMLKFECPVGDNGKALQEPGVTVTQEEWDSSNKKMKGKLSKNVCKSTQHNHENGS